MKNRIPLGIVLLLLLFAAFAVPASAQEPWTDAQTYASADFGASVTFGLQAQASSPVETLELFFQLEGELARNRIEVDTAASTRVNVEWMWSLYPGEIPPGRVISYWWRGQMENGGVLETEHATVDYADQRFDWQERQAGNVYLYWYGTGATNAQNLMNAAEDAVARLEESTGATSQKPVRIFVYNSQSDMSLAIPSRSESYDQYILTLGMAMSGDTIVILGSESGVERTMAHEMSHILIGQFTDNPLGGLPTWLDEGLAMYAEGDLRGDNQRELDRAIRDNTLISVRSLSGYPGDPNMVDLFYGEVYSVVDFLIDTYGPEKMDQLLQTFREGVYQEDALQEVYGFGLDELDDQWREAIGAPPRPTPAPPSEPVAPPQREEPSTGAPICSSAGLVLVLVGAVVWRRLSAA